MTKKMTRRTALKYIGGGVLGLAGITTLFKRKDILAFLDADQRASQSNQGGSGAAVDTRLYRSSGQQLSLLGFGAMRFPTQVINGEKVIDEELSEKMIDYAYRHGVNYFDTAYMYHKGKSEEFLGRVLKKYPRDSYILADKMPGFELDSPARAKEVFQEQLDRCGVEYFDNYFLHYLNKREDFDRFYLQQGVLDYLKEEKARGRIRNLGFSYHGDVPFFEYLMDNFSWDCTLIQLNYQDWNEETETPEGTRIMGSLYRKAAEKGVPCFVMEPVRGGRLASLPEAPKEKPSVEPSLDVNETKTQSADEISSDVSSASIPQEDDTKTHELSEVHEYQKSLKEEKVTQHKPSEVIRKKYEFLRFFQ